MADAALPQSKTCTKCHTDKVLEAFCRTKDGRHGRHSICRQCRSDAAKAYRASDPVKRSAQLLAKLAKARARDKANRRREWHCGLLAECPVVTCSRCRIELPANPAWFRVDGARKTRLSAWCRCCEREIYYRNRDARRLDGALRYIAQREADPDKVRETRRRSKANYPERTRAINRRSREKHLESYRLRQRIVVENRRAAMLASGGKITANLVEKMMLKQAGQCQYCKCDLVNYHIDHVIPLARGGSNKPDNLVLACPTCNRKKGAKMLSELPASFFAVG